MAELLRDQYARGLEKLGYKRVEGRTNRFWVFHNEAARSMGPFVFLGKAGAVRYNSVQRIDGSFSAGDKLKAQLLAKAEE